MNYKLMLICLTVLFLASCSSCGPKTIIVDCDSGSCELPTDASTTFEVEDSGDSQSLDAQQVDADTKEPYQTVSGAGYEFVVPSDWVKMDLPEDPDGIEVLLVNDKKNNLVLLAKEKFSGTSSEYVLEALRGIKAAGATFNSAKQVELNEVQFVLIDSDKSGVSMWLWVTVRNGYGYGLSCGGLATDESHKSICFNIASSLILQ